MAGIPKKVADRLIRETTRFKKILENARSRDVNESDTVTIVSDMLESIFGFDKYSEVTREYAIKGTYCDLAVEVDGQLRYLIEVKAIGLDLKEGHLRQAVSYGASKGIEWVVLTNGIIWKVYHITLTDKVQPELVCSINMLEVNPRRKADQEMLFILCKRGIDKDLMKDMYEYKQSVNRFMLAALIMSDPVVSTIRRELRKVKQGLRVTNDELLEIIRDEVLKRELVESEMAKETITYLKRSQARRKPRARKPAASGSEQPSVPAVTAPDQQES